MPSRICILVLSAAIAAAGKVQPKLNQDRHGASKSIPDTMQIKVKAAELLRDLTVECGTPLEPKRVRVPPRVSDRLPAGKGKGQGAAGKDTKRAGKSVADSEAADHSEELREVED
eukprot:3621513-Amphidinium_carterae.1